MQRRTLLKLGAGAATVLALAGAGVAFIQPGLAGGHLLPRGKAVFEAVARAVLDGSLPTDEALRNAALKAHLLRVGDAIAAFPQAVQAELAQLLAILATSPGRTLLAGLHVDWHLASVTELQAALKEMRHSSLSVRQQAYHALRDLTNAAFYSAPSAWPLLGYPGPRAV
jgi:hypothetical protein